MVPPEEPEENQGSNHRDQKSHRIALPTVQDGGLSSDANHNGLRAYLIIAFALFDVRKHVI